MNKKIKRTTKGLALGVLAAILTLITAVVLVFYFGFMGGPATRSSNIKNYEKVINDESLKTGFIVFPEHILEGATKNDFYYYYRDSFGEPDCVVYLQSDFDAASFDKEILRLENTKKVFGDDVKSLLRDENGKYGYQAYVAIDNANFAYEYALVTGKNQITYIYTCDMYEKNIRFNKSYLPSDFMTDEGREYGSGYSIYYRKATKSMISADYTREQNVD